MYQRDYWANELLSNYRSFVNMFKNNVRQELEGVKKELSNKKKN